MVGKRIDEEKKDLGIDSTNAINLVNIEPFHGYQSIPSQIPKREKKKKASPKTPEMKR